jgi:hypothetical protein
LALLRGFEVRLGAVAGVDQGLFGVAPVLTADWSSILV